MQTGVRPGYQANDRSVSRGVEQSEQRDENFHQTTSLAVGGRRIGAGAGGYAGLRPTQPNENRDR